MLLSNVDMSGIMLMRLQELCKSCGRPVTLFILAQSGKILTQFLYKSFIILFYFMLLQMLEPLKLAM